MKRSRIQTFYKEMYDLIREHKISDMVLYTYPDSLDHGGDSYVVVELPYSMRDMDISDYDVRTSYAKFSFFAKDRIYKTARMPNIEELERMADELYSLLPRRGSEFSMMSPRTVLMPKRAETHYHYMVINVPIVFD